MVDSDVEYHPETQSLRPITTVEATALGIAELHMLVDRPHRPLKEVRPVSRGRAVKRCSNGRDGPGDLLAVRGVSFVPPPSRLRVGRHTDGSCQWNRWPAVGPSASSPLGVTTRSPYPPDLSETPEMPG